MGGTFQGVGQDQWVLLVTEAQFQALLDAKVVGARNGAKGQARDPRSKKET